MAPDTPVCTTPSLPLVSVIIPTYNIAGYITRAITSALSQQGVLVEVIMIDDASTDQTVNIARSITDPRLTILCQPENKGPSIARNTGIAAAKGDWIAVLDGDDYFEDGRLARCVHHAMTSQADIVVDNLNIAHEDSRDTSLMFDKKNPLFRYPTRIDLACFIKGNQSFLGGYTLGYLKPVFRRSFLLRHHLSYPTDIRIGEDYILMAEALACGAICITDPHAGYVYTVRQGSISHRLNLDSVTRIETADAKFLAKYPLDDRARHAYIKRQRKLRIAYDFTRLVDAIKSRNIPEIFSIILSSPAAAIELWRPILARLNRGLKRG